MTQFSKYITSITAGNYTQNKEKIFKRSEKVPTDSKKSLYPN